MKNFLFPLIILAIFGVAVWYLGRRTAFVFGCSPIWFYVIYSLLLVGSVVFTFGGAYSWTNTPAGHVLFFFFSEMLGILLYLLLVTLVVDVVQLFAHFPAWLFGTIVAVLTTGICTGATINAFCPRLTPVTVELPKLQQSLRAVHLTDTHLGHFRGQRHVQRLVHLINDANPDVVFFTGDCFESLYNLNAKTLQPLKQLRAPIYFVDGNHDGYVNADSVKALLRQAGVHVLETEVVEDFGLQIVGLDYMRADDADANSMHAPVGDVTISSFCDTFRASDNLPVVLLHHNPCGGQYLEKAGVDLYLAGHTHGGQLFPLTLINRRAFQFNKGLYRFGRMQVYTSCGTGSFGPPMRLGTRSELTVLNLKPCK